MFDPDHNDHNVSAQEALEHLISLHGDQVKEWPSSIPETMKTDAEAIILKQRKEKSLCPPMDDKSFRRRFFKKTSGLPS